MNPPVGAIQAMGALDGDIVVLGVGGKMGPTLARMAKRASEMAGVKRRVIGVARFSSPTLERRLQTWGVETVRCDLLDLQVAQQTARCCQRGFHGGNEVWNHGTGIADMGNQQLLAGTGRGTIPAKQDRRVFDGKCLRAFTGFQRRFARGRRSKSLGRIRDELRWARAYL